MPVRKIPKNHISVTGRHATSKSIGDADFESPLEKDHLILLDFDPRVKSYEVQPVRLPVPGIPRGYVPDALVHFLPDANGHIPASELIEVKTEQDFRENADEYAPKFAAAEEFVRAKGWNFVLKSDKDIRTPRLKNLKFLRRYQHHQSDSQRTQLLLDALAAVGGKGGSTSLLAATCSSDADKGLMLPALWHLVVSGRIATDWDTPFGADVPLWLPLAHT